MSQKFKKSLGYIFIIGLTILFTSAHLRAAVTVDNSSSYGEFNAVPPVPHMISWPHTIGTGSSRALFVGISRYSTTPLTQVPFQQSVTFNGAPMESLTFLFGINSGDQRSSVQIFKLINPPSGPGTIEATLDPGSVYVFGAAVSFNGVDPAAPNGSFNSNSNVTNSPNINVADTVSGDMVFDILSRSKF